MFSGRSLRFKLLSMCLGLAALLGIVGIIGYISLHSVTKNYGHITSVNLPNLREIAAMRYEGGEFENHYLRLVLPNLSASDAATERSEVESHIKQYIEEEKQYTALPFDEGEEAIAKVVQADGKAFIDSIHKAIELSSSKDARDRAKFTDMIQHDLSKAKAVHAGSLAKLIEYQIAQSKRRTDIAEEEANLGIVFSAGITSIGFIIAALIGFFFSRSLSTSLQLVTDRISDSSMQVNSASQQLSSSGGQLSSAATEAASALAETVASIEEMSSMVKLNADNANEASTLSQSSRKSAEAGESEIKNLNSAMGEIAQSSKKIEEIINVIDDIAFQTNLLALNAAVEAARAGEQGKGFAVVAEAVRNLAQRSAEAAKEITTLIKDSVSKIDKGAKVADSASLVLKEIVTAVKKVADLNNEIASASREQSNGLTQISKAMTDLDQATQRNAASAEETAAASIEMSSQAVVLQDMVQALGSIVSGKVLAQLQPTPTASATTSAMASQHYSTYKAPKRFPNNVSTLRPVTKLEAEAILPMGDAPVAKVGTTDGF